MSTSTSFILSRLYLWLASRPMLGIRLIRLYALNLLWFTFYGALFPVYLCLLVYPTYIIMCLLRMNGLAVLFDDIGICNFGIKLFPNCIIHKLLRGCLKVQTASWCLIAQMLWVFLQSTRSILENSWQGLFTYAAGHMGIVENAYCVS